MQSILEIFFYFKSTQFEFGISGILGNYSFYKITVINKILKTSEFI